MTGPNPRPPATHPAAPPRRTQWTPAKQRIFLTALLESGSVTQAAHAAGMSRSSAHGLRKRLSGTRFDQLWDLTLAEHARRLADPFARDAAPPAQPAAPARQGSPHQRPPESYG